MSYGGCAANAAAEALCFWPQQQSVDSTLFVKQIKLIGFLYLSSSLSLLLLNNELDVLCFPTTVILWKGCGSRLKFYVYCKRDKQKGITTSQTYFSIKHCDVLKRATLSLVSQLYTILSSYCKRITFITCRLIYVRNRMA